MLSSIFCPIIENIKYCAFTFNVLYLEWRQSYGKNIAKPIRKEKKENTRGMGSIRPKNGGYEGRITIKANGKSNKYLYLTKIREF